MEDNKICMRQTVSRTALVLVFLQVGNLSSKSLNDMFEKKHNQLQRCHIYNSVAFSCSFLCSSKLKCLCQQVKFDAICSAKSVFGKVQLSYSGNWMVRNMIYVGFTYRASTTSIGRYLSVRRYIHTSTEKQVVFSKMKASYVIQPVGV